MNKKGLCQKLLDYGFNLTKYKNYEKVYNNLKVSILIYSNLFGKIKMIGILYKFKNQLQEELQDEFWNKSRKIINSQNSYLKIGSLGFDYIEANILDKEILSTIDAKVIDENCTNFVNQISDLLKEYEL